LIPTLGFCGSSPSRFANHPQKYYTYPHMHDIEPYYKWRDLYIADQDEHTPFFGRTYSEFQYSQKIYNYFIHPQWDDYGSNTLFMKLLYADYDLGFALIELIGEWNDCITNDIMIMKREVIDILTAYGISKFVLFCDNVLNFHGDEDDYYEEWYEDVMDVDGWICFLNCQDHVLNEMKEVRLQNYIMFGEEFNDFNWREQRPRVIHNAVENILSKNVKQIA
jgi:hypothetical protein